MAFSRLVDRFLLTGSVHQKKPQGRKISKATEDNCASIRDMVERNLGISIMQISGEMELCYKTVWIILRKELKMYPYKPKNTKPLIPGDRLQRFKFCDVILGGQNSPKQTK